MRQASSKAKPKAKDTNKYSLQIGRRLREAALIIFLSLGVYLVIALTTYHTHDPGWSYSGESHHIANLAGRTGAWFSDLLYYLFGYVAYLFPMSVMFAGVLIYKNYAESPKKGPGWIWPLRVFGLTLALAAGCGLTTLHFKVPQTLLPMSSGGVIGLGVRNGLVSQFSYLGTTVLLLSFFLTGVTLFTGLSWLSVIDNIGKCGFKLIDWTRYFFKNGGKIIKQAFASLLAKVRKTNWRLPKLPQPKPKTIVAPQEMQFASKPFIAPEPFEEDELPPFEAPAPKRKVLPKIKIVKKEVVKKKKPTGPVSAPSLSLLEAVSEAKQSGFNKKQLEDLSRLVEARLSEFGVQVHVVAVHPGPVVTRFELELAPGIKASKISGLAKDLARSLSVVSVRVVEVIPGKPVVGLEIPNQDREIVRLKEILESASYQNSDSPLTLGLGKDISGRSICVDLAKMPHLLVAGTTGSGKSVGLNAMLLSILYKASPEEVRLILIDPKMLELAVYDNIPHLLTPVVTDMKDAANALRWCVAEMEYRYQLMASLGVRNLEGYNRKIEIAQKSGKPILDPLWQPHISEKPEPLETKPYIVVVVDEFADMMMVVGKKVEELIARIAQKARAAGIHLILATQRPSVDVITGLIKANIPTRIAFQVSSRIDSRTILDQQGAEQLLGHGDMLYLPPGVGIPQRIHGAYVADEEVHNVADEWRKQGEPEYIESVTQTSSLSTGGGPSEEGYDELYDEAVKVVTEERRASISHVQRRLKIGYNRAARLIEQMEADGVVSAMQSNGSREVIAPPPPEGAAR